MRARNDFTLVLVTLKPDRRGKTKKVWYYRLANDPKRQKKSTGVVGQRNRWRAEATVRRLLEEQRSRLDSPTFKEYAEPYFMEGTCPHVARLRQELKNIGPSHITKKVSDQILAITSYHL